MDALWVYCAGLLAGVGVCGGMMNSFGIFCRLTVGVGVLVGGVVAWGAGEAGGAEVGAGEAGGSVGVVDVLSSRSVGIAGDFPRFVVPGREGEMEALRDLFWMHVKDLRPMATLWDEWLLRPTIWPAHTSERARGAWRKALESRRIDGDGYVHTHQHGSIAHQAGWPFPFWAQGLGGFGWHFSYHNTIGPGWRPEHVADPEEWVLEGAAGGEVVTEGWRVELTAPGATLAAPAMEADPYQAPFVQVRWKAEGLGDGAQPYLEWTTSEATEFSGERRMYFDPPEGDGVVYSMVPVYRHGGWSGTITGLRLGVGNEDGGGEVVLQGLFAQYDTRHNVNNPSFVVACIDYFHWTHDLAFLRGNIERMRLAMRFMETEFDTASDGIVKMPWVGHEGTTGLALNDDGTTRMLHGRGVGNNYWDLLPFGEQDSYATIRHFAAARRMAELEDEIARNPGWNIAGSPLARSAEHWRGQAKLAKENGNRLFFNEETGRFTLGIDGEGNQADYGFTFLNLEAIAYDFATDEHAERIMEWIAGERIVAGDTAQGEDIYHWVFGPRSTTRRNVEHYGWFWNAPGSIAWGGQVQDGGAVLGFSYHDILARLRTRGAADGAERLETIARWYRDVVNEGGYRAYYDGKKRDGTLQGGGTPGGLGLDFEFFETVLVPQSVLDGFLGFRPNGEGFEIFPKIPEGWPSLTVDNISVRKLVLSVSVSSDSVTIVPSLRNGVAGAEGLWVTYPSSWTPMRVNGGVAVVDETSGSSRILWDGVELLEFRR